MKNKKSKNMPSKDIETIEHSEDVLAALNLLKSQGFLIRKLTEEMKSDASKCREMKSNSEIMDCLQCSCNICAVK